jgi:hypothetical protein
VLAWHHDHFVPQSRAKQKRYHQRERDFWLACAAGLLGDAFAPLTALVIAKLDSIVRASSLVEMVNGLIRPSLNSCKGQVTQATLNLIMFAQFIAVCSSSILAETLGISSAFLSKSHANRGAA